MTRAVAVPLTTLVPRKAALGSSKGLRDGPSTGAAVFSTGSDSPVSVDCVTNRSFADSRRTSAGTMSPAESFTRSPGTNSRIGISDSVAFPFSVPRTTVQVTRTISWSFWAATLARRSWKKRSSPLSSTITPMMIADSSSPVISDTVANIASSAEKAFAKPCQSWTYQLGGRS